MPIQYDDFKFNYSNTSSFYKDLEKLSRRRWGKSLVVQKDGRLKEVGFIKTLFNQFRKKSVKRLAKLRVMHFIGYGIKKNLINDGNNLSRINDLAKRAGVSNSDRLKNADKAGVDAEIEAFYNNHQAEYKPFEHKHLWIHNYPTAKNNRSDDSNDPLSEDSGDGDDLGDTDPNPNEGDALSRSGSGSEDESPASDEEPSLVRKRRRNRISSESRISGDGEDNRSQAQTNVASQPKVPGEQDAVQLNDDSGERDDLDPSSKDGKDDLGQTGVKGDLEGADNEGDALSRSGSGSEDESPASDEEPSLVRNKRGNCSSSGNFNNSSSTDEADKSSENQDDVANNNPRNDQAETKKSEFSISDIPPPPPPPPQFDYSLLKDTLKKTCGNLGSDITKVERAANQPVEKQMPQDGSGSSGTFTVNKISAHMMGKEAEKSKTSISQDGVLISSCVTEPKGEGQSPASKIPPPPPPRDDDEGGYGPLPPLPYREPEVVEPPPPPPQHGDGLQASPSPEPARSPSSQPTLRESEDFQAQINSGVKEIRKKQRLDQSDDLNGSIPVENTNLEKSTPPVKDDHLKSNDPIPAAREMVATTENMVEAFQVFERLYNDYKIYFESIKRTKIQYEGIKTMFESAKEEDERVNGKDGLIKNGPIREIFESVKKNYEDTKEKYESMNTEVELPYAKVSKALNDLGQCFTKIVEYRNARSKYEKSMEAIPDFHFLSKKMRKAFEHVEELYKKYLDTTKGKTYADEAREYLAANQPIKMTTFEQQAENWRSRVPQNSIGGSSWGVTQSLLRQDEP
ncbi:MAG: hypothetical protein ACSNEK_09095 [Parachlamydiaceae bacterium]